MGPEGSSQVVELTLVFLSNVGQSNNSCVFLVDQFAEGSFSLDEAVRDVHLLAEGGEPDDKFDGFDVVGNGDDLGLSVLDELGDVVESEFKVMGFDLGDLFL